MPNIQHLTSNIEQKNLSGYFGKTAFPSDHLAESDRPLINGTATADKMPTMKMTTISSMSVKPFSNPPLFDSIAAYPHVNI